MGSPRKTPRYRGAGKRRRGGIPFHRKHRRLLIGALSLLMIIGLTGAGYAYMLNAKLGNIDKVKVNLDEHERPDPDKGNALNILLLGSDKGEGTGASADTSLEEDAKAAEWPSGKYRSDTIMIVHISADRKNVYLVSIPRDSFVMLHNQAGDPTHEEKINAAFSNYGPTGAVSTVENLTDLRMKHLAIIDWSGFKDLSNAVGGVKVYVPDTVHDPKQNVTWEKGWHLVKGNRALQYVRQRYGLLRGDFDRISRQQNFLRALMNKMLNRGTLTNPVKLTKTLTALTDNLTVDSDWTTGDMRGLALSLRGTSADDVTFMTVPVATTETIPVYGSIVKIDELRAKELFTALSTDTVDEYLRKYPDEALQPAEDIR